MALPHYKLQHITNQAIDLSLASFPVILVPNDPPRKIEKLRGAIRSKKALTTMVLLAVLASAALLWLVLDPQSKVLNLRLLMIPASVIIGCLLFFVLALLLGSGTDESAAEILTEELPELGYKETLPPQLRHNQVEFCFEQWSSEPYNEILADTVVAEIFDDDLLAPDHLVFSLKAEE